MEENENWEVIVVGGGAAGLSAALMLGRARRRVLVVDSGEPRNRFATHMHGMLGRDGTDPGELLSRGREEVSAYDVTIRSGAVDDVSDAPDGLRVRLADGTTVSARALVAASGLTDDLPDVPGLSDQWGTGVLQCPYCHGWEVRRQRLAVLGTSPMSLHQAELIRQWSDQLVFFTALCGPISPEIAARLRSRGVRLVDSPVAEILSDGDRLTGVRTVDGLTTAVDAVFTAPMPRPHDDYLANLALDRADSPVGSFISVDATGKTSHPRVWAVGNIVNPPANVPASMGAGSMAGGMVNMALVTEDFDRCVNGAGPFGRGADSAEDSAEAHWESQYAERAERWSGKVNPTLAEVVSTLPSGSAHTALDLGSGEGGDAVWLAEQGWKVTAVDISSTATARGAQGARDAGVADAITWITHDLSSWETEDTFDLVTASFFHSSVELPRTEILRRAAAQVRPGGHLLIVSHAFEDFADVPPWSLRYFGVDDPRDPAIQAMLEAVTTPDEEVSALALDEAEWDVELQEIRSREASGPDGKETATVKDGVVLLRRADRIAG